jgi:hypothetical protein
MRIRLSDPTLVDELLEYLRRHDVVAERLTRDVINASLPAVPRGDAAILELELYLRVFEAIHPGTKVERIA